MKREGRRECPEWVDLPETGMTGAGKEAGLKFLAANADKSMCEQVFSRRVKGKFLDDRKRQILYNGEASLKARPGEGGIRCLLTSVRSGNC
jgi:hypothetical protein